MTKATLSFCLFWHLTTHLISGSGVPDRGDSPASLGGHETAMRTQAALSNCKKSYLSCS